MAATVQDAGVFAEINTTPLIDVMLVLLTLLIITLPLQTHAVRINLPHGKPAQVLTPPPVVLLDVDWDGTPEWNNRPVDRATLDAYLIHAAHQDPQPELHIHADRFAKYDAVAPVISDAARLGEKRIVFDNTPND